MTGTRISPPAGCCGPHRGGRSGAVLLAGAAAALFCCWGAGAEAIDLPDPPPAATVEARNQSVRDEPPLPPGVATAYMVGALLLEKGELEEALGYLEGAYTHAPDAVPIGQAYFTALLAAGRVERAQWVLDVMCRHHPEDFSLRRQRIALLAERGRHDDALDEIGRVRQLAGTEDPELLLLEAEVLARSGRLREAVPLYRAALAVLPDRREQIVLPLAAILNKIGPREEIVPLWREALTAEPESPRLRLGLLRALVAEGTLEAAVAVADAGNAVAAEQVPVDDGEELRRARGERPSWLVELANLLRGEGRGAEAEQLLEQRRRAGTLDLMSTLWLAQHLIREDRSDAALSVLREAVRRWPSAARARQYLGETLIAAGDLAAGEVELRRAVALAPDEPEFQLSLIRVLTVKDAESGAPRRLGAGAGTSADSTRAELARRAFAVSSQVRAGDVRGSMILGLAFRHLSDLEAAAAQFIRAAEDEQLRREALLQLAACQEDLSRYDDARETLETLRREHPQDPTVANFLGYFLAERGVELERAEQLIREALAKDPQSPQYLDSLGWVAFQRGDYQAALDVLVEAINRLPDDPVILEHIGRALLALERQPEAARMFRRALEAGGDVRKLQRWLNETTVSGDAP